MADQVRISEILIPRFLVLLHALLGHPASGVLLSELKKYAIQVDRLKKKIEAFTRYCLHCNKGPGMVRRPFGEMNTRHAQKPNRLIHMDFIKIFDDYLLTMVDDYSRKVELVYSKTADSGTTAEAILWWRARYGLHSQVTIRTENGSSLANFLMQELT